jgi:hypothetical protein
MSDQQIRALYRRRAYESVPHDSMRRTSRSVSPATNSMPHFYLTVDCDIGKLLRIREEINAAAPKNADGKPLYKLSVNDFVIKAMAIALQKMPDANVTWTEARCCAQAFRHRRRRGDCRRADHADHPQAELKSLSAISERDEGSRRARESAS